MQHGGTDFVENVLSLTPVPHPRGPTAARMALIHFSPHLWVGDPIARHLHAARLDVPERAGDVSRGHWMQMHLISRQADAVVDEIAAIDCAQGRIGVESIGRPLLDCRVRKESLELIRAARDRAHGDSSLA